MTNTQNLQYPFMQNYFPAPQMEIQRVNGEESAKAFPIGPNSSVMLLDSDNPLIWVVTTDASGYKTVTGFNITPYIPKQPVTTSDIKDELSAIVKRLDSIEERMNKNVQSNNGSFGKNKPGYSGSQSNDRNG